MTIIGYATLHTKTFTMKSILKLSIPLFLLLTISDVGYTYLFDRTFSTSFFVNPAIEQKQPHLLPSYLP